MASAVAYATNVPGPRTLTEILQGLREQLGHLSQERLAQRIGVSFSTISRWENGKGKPSPLARNKLVALLRKAGLRKWVADLGENR